MGSPPAETRVADQRPAPHPSSRIRRPRTGPRRASLVSGTRNTPHAADFDAPRILWCLRSYSSLVASHSRRLRATWSDVAERAGLRRGARARRTAVMAGAVVLAGSLTLPMVVRRTAPSEAPPTHRGGRRGFGPSAPHFGGGARRRARAGGSTARSPRRAIGANRPAAGVTTGEKRSDFLGR